MNVILKLLKGFIYAAFLLGVVMFLSAGSFNFWQGWVFLGIYSLYMAVILFLSQSILKRRLQKEKEQKQKFIVAAFAILFILNFVVYGLNRRFNWQHMSANIEIFGYVMIFLGYLIMFISLKQNEYAANNIAIEDNQKVFSGGFYAVVRHPMYLGNIITVLFMPIAFGFYWGFVMSLLLIILLILRITNEEKILISGLNGYLEYCRKVKWRLVPYIW